MPVSPRRRALLAAQAQPGAAALHHRLRKPQATVLALLVPADPTSPVWDWPVVNRTQLGARAGYTPLSGTVTRVLNGVRAGSSSNDHRGAEPGLLALGYVEEVVLDVEGLREVNYRATAAGVQAYREYEAKRGTPKKSRNDATSTNKRYRPCPCGSGKQFRECCKRRVDNTNTGG